MLTYRIAPNTPGTRGGKFRNLEVNIIHLHLLWLSFIYNGLEQPQLVAGSCKVYVGWGWSFSILQNMTRIVENPHGEKITTSQPGNSHVSWLKFRSQISSGGCATLDMNAGWWFQPTPLKNHGVRQLDDDIPNCFWKVSQNFMVPVSTDQLWFFNHQPPEIDHPWTGHRYAILHDNMTDRLALGSMGLLKFLMKSRDFWWSHETH